MFTTREEWLTAAVSELRPLFDLWSAPVPAKVRVTCGFPSNARRSGAIGECWIDQASSDQTFEIFISPTLDDPRRVFDVLVHELCHTLPQSFKHNKTFGKHAAAMHLTAAPTWKSTAAGAGFDGAYGAIISGLGAYPHASLNMITRKKQATRMLKASCPTCSYTIRLTSKWAAQGLPTCICGDIFNLDNSEGE